MSCGHTQSRAGQTIFLFKILNFRASERAVFLACSCYLWFYKQWKTGPEPIYSCSTTHANHCSACTITIKPLHGRLAQAKNQPIKSANTSNAGPSLFIRPMNIGKLDGIIVLWIRSLRSMVRSFHFIVRSFHSFSIKLDEIKSDCFCFLA